MIHIRPVPASPRRCDPKPGNRNRAKSLICHHAKWRFMMASEEFTDAIALLKADHRTVEELFE